MSIVIENVNFTYMKKTPFEKRVLADINITIEKGEIIGLIGHTGSGKSTLIQHFNGLLKPDSGNVFINGININKRSKEALIQKRKVGLVFQYPEYQLFEETIGDDIRFGPKNYGLDTKEIEKRVRFSMEVVGLSYHEYVNRSPFFLSGGQRRRVALAGILVLEPEYLILDEPSSGLDPNGKRYILDKISEIQKKRGCTVVMISHDMEEIAKYTNRIIVMNNKRIILDNKKEFIFKKIVKLQKIGLDIPDIIKIMRTAKQRGLNVKENIFDRQEGAEQLAKAYREKINVE